MKFENRYNSWCEWIAEIIYLCSIHHIILNKENMLKTVKKYLANKYNCDIKELDKTGLNIIKNNSEN